MENPQPILVPFISTEHGDDLIVSFPLGLDFDTSLILLRSPKYEQFLYEQERGVSVSTGDADEDEDELLVSVNWLGYLVEIKSTRRHFLLDVRRVDAEEVKKAKAVLRKMNFDKRLRLMDV